MMETEGRPTQKNDSAVVLFNIFKKGQLLHPETRNIIVDDSAMPCHKTNVIERKETLEKDLEYPTIYLVLGTSSLIRRKLRLVSSTGKKNCQSC